MSIAWSIYGAGAYFPEFKDAESWRMRSEGATYKYMAKNMKGDGMNIEPAENYHLYSLSLANRLQKLAAMNGYTVLQDLSELLERGGEVLMDLSLPNFEMPLIGDTASKSMDITGFMSDYSGYYGRDDFEFIATKGAAGTVPNKSVFYPNSFAIMKTGWNTNDKYMVIENEDTDYTGSHNHPDDLSLMMYAFGKRLIVDPGVNNYNNIASSNWLRQSTRAHNTIEVSNSPQGNLNRSAIKWLSNDGFDFYHGRHQDYLPINHNRKVFFAKPDFWIVSDLMTGGTTSETYRQLWHFMPTTVSLDATTKRASTSFSDEANVKVVPADPSTLTATVQTDGYYSHTGDVVQSNVQYLSFGRTATGTTSFDTVLYPEPNGSNKNVTVTRLTTGVAASVATALEIGHDTGNSGNISAYYLSHETNPGTRSFGAYNYNGELAYIEKTSGGSLVSTSIAKGTLLKDGTTNLISATATVQNLSVRYSGATLNLYSSDLLTPSITIYAPGVTSVKLNDSTITFSVSGNFITVGGAAIPTTGTTVLTDDFDIVGLTSQNWDFEDSLETGWKEVVGTWSIDTQGGSKVYRESNSAGLSKAVVTESKWSDVLVQSDVTTVGANGSYNGVGLYARYQDSTNNYLFQYYTNGGTPQLQIVKNFNGTSTVLANISFTMTTNTKYTLKAVVSGNVLKFYVDNVLKLTAYDSDVFMGYSGLYAHRRDAYFDNVKVTELADGDKWKVGKGHFLINSYELYSDSLNEANSEISSKVQNDWKDTLAEAKVKVAAWGAAPGRAGIVTRSLGGNDGYRFIVYNDGTARKLRIERVVSGLRADATPVVLAEKAYTFNTGTFYTFKAVADGGILKFYVNGTEELTAYDTLLSKGGFSLHASKAQVRFDDVLVKTIP
ncbi:MAG: Heparinase family protein, partial [Paenibacillus sp.]|nr:Heparinase family protein [Paenibacillus sp.]